MTDSQSLKIIVFGSNGLIGSSLSKYLNTRGHKLFLGDINDLPGYRLSNSIYNQVNVLDESSLESFFDSAIKELGHIDAVLPLAYPRPSSWGQPLEDLSLSTISAHMEAQLGSVLCIFKYALNQFKRQEKSNFIFFSSIQGVCPPKFDHYVGTNMQCPIEYVAAKAGIIATTKYLAKYYKDYNIKVNCISPGGILNSQDPSFIRKYNNDCLSKGMLEARDLHGIVEFLLNEKSAYINGQNIIIDDGWSL